MAGVLTTMTDKLVNKRTGGHNYDRKYYILQ